MAVLLDRLKVRCDIDPVTGCWIWKQTVNGTGYPSMSLSGLTKLPIHGMSVRRLAYMVAVGELSNRRAVVATCGEPLCICPDHLKALTKGQVAKANLTGWDGTAEVRRDIRQYKLDRDKAARIRDMARQGMKSREIADHYGVSTGLVRRVITGKLWAPAQQRAPTTWHP